MLKPLRPLTAALAIAISLAACSSMGPNAPGPSARAVDTLTDDIGALLFALDLPRGIGPMPGATVLTYAIPAARPIKAVLVSADVDDLASQLPPPGNGRAYYFLALAPKDRTSIRTIQAGAAGAHVAQANVTLSIAPGLCESAIVVPSSVSISVLAASSGGEHLLPLIDRRPISELLGTTATLPACP